MLKIADKKKILFLVWFFFIICFGFVAWKKQTSDNQVDLKSILKNSAVYCERLKEAVFHFVCLEVVTEKIEKKLSYPENRRGLKNFLEGNRPRSRSDYQYEAHRNQDLRRLRDSYKGLKGGMKTLFTYDYQIIQLGKKIHEQRLLLKVEQDKKVYNKSNYTPILYSFKNAMVPIYFFSAENQPRYKYRLMGKTRVLKRKTYKVLVFSNKEEQGAAPLAKVLIDQEDFSIVKFIVFPGAIKGYHQLLRVGGQKISKIDIQDVHEFGLLRDGIRYPTHTDIKLSYQSDLKNVMKNQSGSSGVKVGAVVLAKIQTLVKYKDYRFFNVQVASPVFKKVN